MLLTGCRDVFGFSPGSLADASAIDASDAADAFVEADAAIDAPIDAPTFSPKSIAGLVLWLDASQGVIHDSGDVSGWTDESGSGNDAVMVQNGFRPILMASSIHGKPAIHFDGGTHLAVADAPTLRWGTGDFYIATVVQYANTVFTCTQGCMVFSKQELLNPFPGPSLQANYNGSTYLAGQTQYDNMHYVVTGANGLNDNVPRQFSFARRNGNLFARLNGNAGGTQINATTNVDALGLDLNIGANSNGGQSLTGDIAEIIAIKGTASFADVANIETYLQAKYAL